MTPPGATDTAESSTVQRRPWREGLFEAEPFRLLGSRCNDCGVSMFPSREFCPACRHEPADMEPTVLPSTGVIHTFTVVRQAPAGIETPYVLARIRLDNGTRVLSTVRYDSIDAVDIGTSVRLVEETFTRRGEQLGGFAFTTIKENAR